MLFVLIGIALYTLLGGADFGAGLWQLTFPGPEGRELREQAHDRVGPVWEANHVWLIFVLTVMWTAYPPLFGSVASTLAVPLFIAAVGIIFRGATYALYAGASTSAQPTNVSRVPQGAVPHRAARHPCGNGRVSQLRRQVFDVERD